jgi:hypothetical protein
VALGTGGSGATGFTAQYTAGAVAGYDNITVEDTLALASNESAINITMLPPLLSYIILTPEYLFASPWEVKTGGTLSGYTALGYNDDDSLNTTWTPTWATTDSLGSVVNQGGSAAAGYTADYLAGGTLGFDNITVASGSVTDESAIEVIVGNLSKITLTPWNDYPAAASLKVGLTLMGYAALGYDGYGNKNVTWTAQWGTSHSLGTALSTGGTAATGYTASYTAGGVPGFDNITVRDSLATASNSSCIEIIPGDLFRIELTPFHTISAPNTVSVGKTLTGYLALGYDTYDNLNLTWTPVWGTSDSLGTATDLGGNQLTGFLAQYTAGTAMGLDNITVADAESGLITNVSSIRIIEDTLSYITLTPKNDLPAYTPVMANQITGFFVAFGYDQYGNLNTTWTAVWSITDVLGSVVSMGGSAVTGFQARFQAGTVVGYDNITVRDSVISAVNNHSCIRIVPAAPFKIEIVSGDNQTGDAGAVLPEALNVKVSDEFGNHVGAGIPVYFNVTSTGLNNDGLFQGAGANTSLNLTDANGTCSVTFKLDTKSGLNSVSAEVLPTISTTFSENGEAGPLLTLTLTPPTVTIPVGTSADFTLEGADQFGNAVVLTGTVWETDSGTLANETVTGCTLQGNTTPLTGGFVKATVGTVSASSVVNLIAGPLFEITVTPNPVTLNVSESREFTAVGADQYGNPVDLVSTSWETDCGSIGTFNDSTAVLVAQDTAVTGGNVRATSQNVSGSAVVDVVQVQTFVPPLLTLVQPTAGAKLVGTATLIATATDADDDITADGVTFYFQPDGGDSWTKIDNDPDADASNQYQVEWNTNTTATPNGKYTIKAEVFDEQGLSADGTVSVDIDNPTGPGVDEDTDDDGLPDAWELEHFQTLDYGPSDDNDNDTIPNLQEYQDGTDPTVPDEPADDDDDDDDDSNLMAFMIIIPLVLVVLLVIIVIAVLVLRKKKIGVRIGPFYQDGQPALGTLSFSIDGKRYQGDTDREGIADIDGLSESNIGKTVPVKAVFDGKPFQFNITLMKDRVINPPKNWAGPMRKAKEPMVKKEKAPMVTAPGVTEEMPGGKMAALPEGEEEEDEFEEYHEEFMEPDMEDEDMDLEAISLDDLDDEFEELIEEDDEYTKSKHEVERIAEEWAEEGEEEAVETEEEPAEEDAVEDEEAAEEEETTPVAEDEPEVEETPDDEEPNGEEDPDMEEVAEEEEPDDEEPAEEEDPDEEPAEEEEEAAEEEEQAGEEVLECPVCGSEISENDTECPRCLEELPKDQ